MGMSEQFSRNNLEFSLWNKPVARVLHTRFDKRLALESCHEHNDAYLKDINLVAGNDCWFVRLEGLVDLRRHHVSVKLGETSQMLKVFDFTSSTRALRDIITEKFNGDFLLWHLAYQNFRGTQVKQRKLVIFVQGTQKLQEGVEQCYNLHCWQFCILGICDIWV